MKDNKLVVIDNSPLEVKQAFYREQIYHPSDSKPPRHFTVTLIQHDRDGIHEITLNREQLDKVFFGFKEFRDEILYEYNNPETDCCAGRRPREEVVFKDGTWCKPGFGCRKGEKQEAK